MSANEDSLTLGFAVETRIETCSFYRHWTGDYCRYGEELHDKYVARKAAELDVDDKLQWQTWKMITIFTTLTCGRISMKSDIGKAAQVGDELINKLLVV